MVADMVEEEDMVEAGGVRWEHLAVDMGEEVGVTNCDFNCHTNLQGRDDKHMFEPRTWLGGLWW